MGFRTSYVRGLTVIIGNALLVFYTFLLKYFEAMYPVVMNYNCELLPQITSKLDSTVSTCIGDMQYTFNLNVTPVTYVLTLKVTWLFVSMITQVSFLIKCQTQTLHPMVLWTTQQLAVPSRKTIVHEYIWQTMAIPWRLLEILSNFEQRIDKWNIPVQYIVYL